jgi:hypothetical protein
MSVFQTGKIIITGGRYLYQLEEAYNFLNMVLQRHAADVLKLPVPAPASASASASASAAAGGAAPAAPAAPAAVRQKSSAKVTTTR